MEKKKIAIIAHDGKKAEMVAFLNQNKESLKHFKIVATGTTGNMHKKQVSRLKNIIVVLLEEMHK